MGGNALSSPWTVNEGSLDNGVEDSRSTAEVRRLVKSKKVIIRIVTIRISRFVGAARAIWETVLDEQD